MDDHDDRRTDGERERLDRRAVLEGLGVGLLALAAAEPATAQDEEGGGEDADGEEGEDGGEAGDSAPEDEDGGEGGGGETVTVTLVDFAFEPATSSPLEVPPGTTVQFVWQTDNHNVVVDSQPEDAGWEGYETLEDSGFEYEHTFEVEGEYAFYCEPHIGQGMEGTIVVDPEASVGGGEGGGPAQLVPDAAMTLLIATVASLVSVLGLSYAFMKYGGPTGR